MLEFLKSSYDEFTHKVTWSSWNELQTSTIVVAVFTILVTLFIAAGDYLFNKLILVLFPTIR